MPPIQLNIHVNSSMDRRTTDTTTHDWTTFLNKPLSLSGSQKMTLSVENIEMPNSAYTFPPGESTLWYLDHFTDNPASYDGGVTWNIVKYINLAIDQVYDAASLVAALNAGMVANSDSAVIFSYNTVKGKLSVVNTDATKDYFLAQSYRFGNTAGYAQVLGVRVAGPVIAAANNIIDRLGFGQEDLRLYRASGFTYTPVVAAGLVRLNRTNCYFLTCESISSKIKQSQNPSPYVTANIIGKMPAGQFGTISVIRNPTESFDFEVQDRVIESFKFGILDDQLNTIDLNHCIVTFTLKITIV
jgi:hypothetical protein